MSSMADKVMKRVAAHHRGRWVCSPKDFLDLGSREAVDQALLRLVKAGRLRRVGRGLYDMPSTTVVIPYHESGVAGNDNTGLAIDGAAATCTKPTRVRPHATPAPPNARANVVSPPHSEPDPRPNQRPDPRLTRRPHQAPRRLEAQQTAQRRAFFSTTTTSAARTALNNANDHIDKVT